VAHRSHHPVDGRIDGDAAATQDLDRLVAGARERGLEHDRRSGGGQQHDALRRLPLPGLEVTVAPEHVRPRIVSTPGSRHTASTQLGSSRGSLSRPPEVSSVIGFIVAGRSRARDIRARGCGIPCRK
jgi:hypothetical protein